MELNDESVAESIADFIEKQLLFQAAKRYGFSPLGMQILD